MYTSLSAGITLVVAQGVASDPSGLLEYLKLINGPGGWLIVIIVLWKYIGKDLVSTHVSISENNRLSISAAERTAFTAERTAQVHEAGSKAAEATVAMAKEIVIIAKGVIDTRSD